MGMDNSTLNVVGKEESGAPDVGYEDPGDFPMKLPAYWSTTEGIHLIPDRKADNDARVAELHLACEVYKGSKACRNRG